MKKQTIALVMCVKNEEKGLLKAVRSCSGFVDEIHISVDSKSSDRTLEIAKSLTNNVKVFEFEDDFSKMRNQAHEGITTDWLFFLDGHEFVSRADRLQEALNLDADGLLCRIRMENGFEFRNPRIYKNGVQFFGEVHEQVDCEFVVKYDTFVVQHDRIESQNPQAIAERDAQRDDHMIRIVGAQSDADPANTHASFQLALFYESKGNYKKALYYQKLHLKYSKNAGERWLMYFERSLCYLALNSFFRAFWNVWRAENEQPERWENEKLKGLVYFSAGKYEKALQPLVNSFNKNKKDFEFKPWKPDYCGTWNLLGECYYRRGVYDKASTCFTFSSDQAVDEVQKKFFKDRAILMADMSKGR